VRLVAVRISYASVVSCLQTIQVGSDYQAVVPHGLSKYGDAPGNLYFLFL